MLVANFKILRSGGSGATGGAPCEKEVHFIDLTDGVVTSWAWDFGDGLASVEQSSRHTYTEEGVYTISLTVTGPGGTDTLTKDDFVTIGQTLPQDEDFLQGYRLMKDDLIVRFYSLNIYMPQGCWNLYSPYEVWYEIGFLDPVTAIYYRIGTDGRVPVEVSTGVFRANFIIGDRWSVGEYRIIWRYRDTADSGIRAKCEKFTVTTEGIFDSVGVFHNFFDLAGSMTVIP